MKRKRGGISDGGENDSDSSDDEDDEEEDNLQGQVASSGAGSGTASTGSSITHKQQPSAGVSKYSVSKFKSFDSKHTVTIAPGNDNGITNTLDVSDYGASIADLNFQLVLTSTTGGQRRGRHQQGETNVNDRNNKNQLSVQVASTVNTPMTSTVPTKLVKKLVKIQFTCQFHKLYSVTGHTDYRQLRTLLQHLKPKHDSYYTMGMKQILKVLHYIVGNIYC